MNEVALRERGSWTRKTLGMFGLNRRLAQSSQPRDDEYNYAHISADYIDWNSGRHALCEAERNKTEALLERQRRSFT